MSTTVGGVTLESSNVQNGPVTGIAELRVSDPNGSVEWVGFKMELVHVDGTTTQAGPYPDDENYPATDSPGVHVYRKEVLLDLEADTRVTPVVTLDTGAEAQADPVLFGTRAGAGGAAGMVEVQDDDSAATQAERFVFQGNVVDVNTSVTPKVANFNLDGRYLRLAGGTLTGPLTLEQGGSPALYTGTGGAELNRYLQLLNSPALSSASGLKCGGLLVADSYAYANPGKNDVVVKGRVGIGTSVLGAPLTVRGDRVQIEGIAVGTANVAYLQFTDQAGTQSGWIGEGSSGHRDIIVYANNDFRVYATGAERLKIAAGRVGIGTSNPIASLHHAGQLENEGQGRFKGWFAPGQGSGLAVEVGASGGQGYIYAYDRTYLAHRTLNLGSSGISINPAGNVGIGTTIPGYTLDVAGSTRFQASVIDSFGHTLPGIIVRTSYDSTLTAREGTLQVVV